ncbi:class I SAM-dependent DNA methyltransferase [Piscibacillus sp. B03]|uniref:class I SAM-dependent DNA methyltransferase n=1 Tax=Piscibacillus sp. B03 TaxID=3457430 RepID=UPI003FCE8A19
MYNKLAEVYDSLMNDAPYEMWIQFASSIKPKDYCRVLDMGCGTGEIAIELAHKAHSVTAFDLSHEMIEVAKAKDSSVTFSQGDVRSFDYNINFDLIISYCDVLNYLTDESELLQVFERVYKHLNDDGVFSFDIHSMNYINWLIQQEVFSEVRNDLSYIWFTEEGEGLGEVYHDLTFFVKEPSGLFKRYDERHFQRTFSVDTYKKLLKKAGFNHIQLFEDFDLIPSHNISEETNRIFFVCKKH